MRTSGWASRSGLKPVPILSFASILGGAARTPSSAGRFEGSASAGGGGGGASSVGRLNSLLSWLTSVSWMRAVMLTLSAS
jgi:hypothetical protein